MMLNTSITSDHLNELADSATVQYFHNKKTTVCIMTLPCGFEVIGTSSVVDKAKFDEFLGRRYAFENAVNKLWELEGYRLQWKLHEQRNG